MRKSFEIALLISILLGSAGLTIGLTYLPCYASLCSEEFYPYETRIHVAFFYVLLASLSVALFLRTASPTARAISEYYLWSIEVPVLAKRISVGGLAASIWIVGLTLATTGFWLQAMDFWALRTDPIEWVDAKIRLLVTCIIGHHIDILLGLVIIPVARNSILGRVFELHTKIILANVYAEGKQTFVGTYRVQSEDVKALFEIDNPALTQAEAEKRGKWWFVNLPTGMIAFVAMLVIIISALPVLRRRSYNAFYYLHVIMSLLIVILLSFHASTDFYFLIPGLLLWFGDWAWRLFRGMGGLRKRVTGKLENAGNGWYRISLPVSAKLAIAQDDVEPAISERRMPTHPLQSYFLVFPKISKIQNHAFTAAKVVDLTSGPTFLFQRAAGKKQKKRDKEWTWKLAGTVNDAPGDTKEFKVRVEGPYIPSVPELFTASRIICIVGGTGLTGAYGIALWWLKFRSNISGASLTLIWTIRHRETAAVREWQDLVQTVAENPKVTLVVHVTSEQGRLNALETLRGCLSALSDHKEKGNRVSVGGEAAWVYLSGPEGLLRAGERPCLDLRKEVRKGRTSSGVDALQFYSAKWEV